MGKTLTTNDHKRPQTTNGRMVVIHQFLQCQIGFFSSCAMPNNIRIHQIIQEQIKKRMPIHIHIYLCTYIILYTCTSKSSFRTSCGVLAISLEQQLRQGVPIFQVVGVGEPGCRTIPQLRHQAALPFRFLNWPRSLNGRRKILKYIFITIGYILIYIIYWWIIW